MKQNSLLVNLSVLSSKPTGLSNYSFNLSKVICTSKATTFLSHQKPDFIKVPSQWIQIPNGLNTDFGKIGHLKRLLWLQFILPKIFKKLSSTLLFSPVPEAPIYTDVRHVITVHDIIPLRFSAKHFSPLKTYFKHYVPTVLNYAEHILADSEATAQDLRSFYDISLSKVTVIPLSYDADNFRFLDLPTQDYFVYLGRFDLHKNLKRIIAAFFESNLYKNYKLHLVGSLQSPYLPELKAYIQDLGLTDAVLFFDYISYQDLPVVLNQSLALVLPSLWEGFGLPVLEAMACGTPVITSNISSLPEVAGDAAILVDPYNVAEIADAMKAIATNSQLRKELRYKGLKRAAQFSWEKTARLTMEVLYQHM
ncbi:glycosyltransferase family 4 protein [Leptolyngbya sp. PCC 6406]|uniref:glycosyltransferase family 4 protein n=1 Tax=Leptolyngbya sp. PCC 6406 TaxID=1173264 RepID=UPI0002AC5989|nr:glycosyltransferase family 1 protein [Leptolyngbya sp. PCC 6406]